MNTKIMPFIDVTVNAEWSDWQNYPNGRPNPLYSKEAAEWGVDGLIFSFITLSPGKKPCWAGQDSMPKEWALPLANELKAKGLSSVISFGGAVNSDISTFFSVLELVDIYQDFIDMYSASGLDFDLENGLYNLSNIMQALVTIQQNNPALTLSFTLPTLPTGLTSTGLDIVERAKHAGLTFIVNGMAMDYYDPNYRNKMGEAAVDAATSIEAQMQSLHITGGFANVAITPMIGLNDDNSMFGLNDTDTVAAFAREKGMGFLAMWDFNRDNPSSYQYVDLTTSSNPAQRTPGEYTRRFVSGVKA